MKINSRELNDVNGTRAVHPEGKSSTCASVKSSKMWPPPPPPRPPSLGSSTRSPAPRLQDEEMHLTQLPFPAARNISSHLIGEAQILQEIVQLANLSLNESTKQHQDKNQKPLGLKVVYSLGEKPRSSSHIIIESSTQKATEMVSRLKIHDFAWIKRSNGSWTYAILAYKSYIENALGIKEECLVFAMSTRGATRAIKKHQWAECIRLVAAEEKLSHTVLGIVERNAIIKEMLARYRQIKMEKLSWIPESVVLDKSDEVSLVSFFSS